MVNGSSCVPIKLVKRSCETQSLNKASQLLSLVLLVSLILKQDQQQALLRVWEQDYMYNVVCYRNNSILRYYLCTCNWSILCMSNVQVVSRGHAQNFHCLPYCIGTSFTHIGYVKVNTPLWRNKDCVQLFLVSIIAPFTENRLYICKQCKTLECN